ncbi:glycosyltransferase family 4 protein [Salidesulfovibrio onnuriiensis]|uniref:glycosyltransferase family 4 protein n=1 Tax=Salidesulfovibrio onnuriiensis TaxID=2583823 RepID=UPI0011C6F84D|nr:glycosyltransferase family 4 protein [Salidesulfovibrio onnuriiensis]
MKILVLGSLAPSLTRFRGALLAEMVARGHEVLAMAPPFKPDAAPELAAMGVAYAPIEMQRRGLNPLADLGLLFRLRREFERLRPDVVLAYTIKPVVYGAVAARLAGVPRFFSLITGLGYAFTEASGLRRRVLFNLARGLYAAGLRFSSGALFQNPDDPKFFRTIGVLPANLPVAVTGGSGVDLDHYNCTEPPELPSFLCLSRFLRSKGVVEYAEAAVRLKARFPEATFRLVGPREHGPDGIDDDTVRSWQKGGLEVLPAVDDVRPYLTSASVYVLPSWREGTPRSVLEAMSTGRAVITTDAPGCRETVERGVNGFLVPVHDVDSLAAAMERLMDMELAARMGAASRRLAEERFDVTKVNEIILNFMGVS